MTRSTRNIVLGLIGSALLCSCCFVSCVDVRDEDEKDANGNVVRRHRHYYFRPWYSYSGGGWTYHPSYYPSYGRSYIAPAPTVPGRPGGGPMSTSGVTSRGGFGSTGHATVGS
jgi:hypothetical protein